MGARKGQKSDLSSQKEGNERKSVRKGKMPGSWNIMAGMNCWYVTIWSLPFSILLKNIQHLNNLISIHIESQFTTYEILSRCVGISIFLVGWLVDSQEWQWRIVLEMLNVIQCLWNYTASWYSNFIILPLTRCFSVRSNRRKYITISYSTI